MDVLETTTSRSVQNLSLTKSESTTTSVSIRDAVIHYVQYYLNQLWENHPKNDLYEKILNEIEPPILEVSLHYCRNNQV